MRSLFGLARENRATSAMLLFLAFFYSLLFILGHSGKKEGREVDFKKAETITYQDIQKREEVFKKNIQERPGLQKNLSIFFVLLLLAGVCLNGYLLIKKFVQGRPWIRSQAPPPPAAWGFREILQAFVLLFFLEALILLLEAVVVAAFGLKDPGNDFFMVLNSLVRDGLVFVWLLYLVRKKLGRPVSDLGLTSRQFVKNLFLGIAGYVAVIPAMLLCFLLLSFLMQVFSYEPLPQNVVQIYLKKSSDPFLFYLTVFVAVLGPVIEEIFFRGFAYGPMRRRFVPVEFSASFRSLGSSRL